MSLGLFGLIVSPVGWAFALSSCQLPFNVPEMVYLKTLSLLLLSPSFTTQKYVPSVTMPLALLLGFLPVARVKLLAGDWLPLSLVAAPVYLNTVPDPSRSTIQRSLFQTVMPSG